MRLIHFAFALGASLFGSMASAASVQNIDTHLRFDGNVYYNAVVTSPSGSTLFKGDTLTEADDQWGLPRLFDFAVGEVLDFTATLRPSTGEPDTGEVMACSLGGLDCMTGASFVGPVMEGFTILYGTNILFNSESLKPGSDVLYTLLLPLLTTNRLTETGDRASWLFWQGAFTVVDEQPQPAPVPLPATALLLPAGLAGLAMLRRRQKRHLA